MTALLPWDVALEEAAFQAVHLVDTGQTLDLAAHERRWHESASWLNSGWVIGARPSQAAVWRYMGAEAVLHAAVTLALVRWGPRWASRVWEVTTISVDGATVANNARIGLRVRW